MQQSEESDLDLNIDHYDVPELETFLQLKRDDYTLNDVHDKCDAMRTVVHASKAYDKLYKTRIGIFLDEAKLKLVRHLKSLLDIQREGESRQAMENAHSLLSQDPIKDKVVNQTSTTYAGHTFVMNPESTSLNRLINPDKHIGLDPINTFPTHVARDVLNPLKRKTLLQTIIVNTLFREDYFNTSPSDFALVLPCLFKNVLSVRLSSLQLPSVLYTISAANGNNTFYLEEVGGVAGTVIFPDGNYPDLTEFCALLEHEIKEQLGTPHFVVNCDPHSGKLTIANHVFVFRMVFSTPSPVLSSNCTRAIDGAPYAKTFTPTDGQRSQKCVELEELYKRFGWAMGFRDELYEGQMFYTTEALFGGTTPSYLYFVLNDFNAAQAQSVFGMYSKSLLGDNILAMIPFGGGNTLANGGDFIERKRTYFGPVRLQRLRVQLLNPFGEVVQLNHMDYSFSLELEVGYDV